MPAGFNMILKGGVEAEVRPAVTSRNDMHEQTIRDIENLLAGGLISAANEILDCKPTAILTTDDVRNELKS